MAELTLLQDRRPGHDGAQDLRAVVHETVNAAAMTAGALDAAAPVVRSVVDDPDLPSTTDDATTVRRRHLGTAQNATGELADRVATLTSVAAGD